MSNKNGGRGGVLRARFLIGSIRWENSTPVRSCMYVLRLRNAFLCTLVNMITYVMNRYRRIKSVVFTRYTLVRRFFYRHVSFVISGETYGRSFMFVSAVIIGFMFGDDVSPFKGRAMTLCQVSEDPYRVDGTRISNVPIIVLTCPP